MATETKIIQIEINHTTALNDIVELQKKIELLNKANEKLLYTETEKIKKNGESITVLKKKIDLTEQERKAYAGNTVQLREYKAQLNSLVKESANEIKVHTQKIGYLEQLTADVSNLEKAYYRLSKAELDNKAVGGAMVEQLKKKRAELASAQAEYGKYSMNVGNYASATNMLAINVGQVMKEIPNFAISARIGIMSLTNNLPMLAEAMKAVVAQQKAMKAEGQAVPSLFSLISKSIFGLTGIMSIAMVLFQVFGEDILKWVGSLFKGVSATDLLKKSIDNLNISYERSKMLMKENIDIQNIYLEKRSDQIRNEKKMEMDRWMNNEALEKTALERKQRTYGKLNKVEQERYNELLKLEKEYFNNQDKLESEYRVAIQQEKKKEDDERKKETDRVAKEKSEQNKKDKKEQQQKLKDEALALIEHQREMYQIYLDNASLLEELNKEQSDNKLKAEEDIAKKLLTFAKAQHNAIKLMMEEEYQDADSSLNAMLEKYKNFHKSKVNEAENDLATTQNLGQADYDATIQLLNAKRDAEIFNARLIGEDTTKIEAYYNSVKQKMNVDMLNSQLSAYSSMFGSLASMLEENSIGQKVAATAQATINTYLGATAAFAQTPGDIITKSIAAAAAVAAGLANVYQIWKVDTSVPENNAAQDSKVTSTTSEKFHTGTYRPASASEEKEITSTLLTTERVLSPMQTGVFDSIINRVQSMGGSSSITSNVGVSNAIQAKMFEMAMSKALRNMPAPVMSWSEFQYQKDRMRQLEQNKFIR